MLGFVTQPGSGLPPTHHPRNARSNSLVGLSIDAMNGRSECISQKDLKNAPPPAFTFFSPKIGRKTVNTPRARGVGRGGSIEEGPDPPRGGPGEAFLGGVQKSRFLTPPGGVGGVPPPGGHFPLPKIRPQPEKRTGKKPTKLYSTKCRPKTAFFTPPEGGVTPGGVTLGLRPPPPDPPGGVPPFGPPFPPREGGVRTAPPEGVRDPPPGVPGADRGWPTRSGCRAGAPDPTATWPPSS